jgi:glyoxylase-like metal-dependent hydrolase (beta-lactamase superfamily II)
MLEQAQPMSAGAGLASPTRRTADEIVPGRIYRLGGFIELDGRISWAPEMPGRFTPNNCYTVMEADRVYLVDTGVAAHREIRQASR